MRPISIKQFLFAFQITVIHVYSLSVFHFSFILSNCIQSPQLNCDTVLSSVFQSQRYIIERCFYFFPYKFASYVCNNSHLPNQCILSNRSIDFSSLSPAESSSSPPSIDLYFPPHQDESPSLTDSDDSQSIRDKQIGSPSLPPFNDSHITYANNSSIRICKSPDASQLNECLRQVLEDLKPRLADGIPEIGLPGMDPLFIPELSFEHGGGSIKINAHFANIEVTGLSKFNESQFWVDTQNHTMDFDVTFPHALLAGSYKLTGNLLFVPVAGDGHFWLNLGGVKCKGTGNLSVQNSPASLRNETGETSSDSSKRQQKRITLHQPHVDLDISSIKVHLTNLFNGDQVLGPVINNFLNENSQEIFDELRPQIGDQVGEMLSLLANKALSVLPSDYFPQIISDDDDEGNQDEDITTTTISPLYTQGE